MSRSRHEKKSESRPDEWASPRVRRQSLGTTRASSRAALLTNSPLTWRWGDAPSECRPWPSPLSLSDSLFGNRYVQMSWNNHGSRYLESNRRILSWSRANDRVELVQSGICWQRLSNLEFFQMCACIETTRIQRENEESNPYYEMGIASKFKILHMQTINGQSLFLSNYEMFSILLRKKKLSTTMIDQKFTKKYPNILF